MMKNNYSTDFKPTLEMLKYYYSQINYAGKIQRMDDQVILEALVEDLFSETMIFHEDQMGKNLEKSHFGYPPDASNTDYYLFLDRHVDEQDPYEVYGFNFNVERTRNVK